MACGVLWGTQEAHAPAEMLALIPSPSLLPGAMMSDLVIAVHAVNGNCLRLLRFMPRSHFFHPPIHTPPTPPTPPSLPLTK